DYETKTKTPQTTSSTITLIRKLWKIQESQSRNLKIPNTMTYYFLFD
uniref:Uncharacterized protein n=1 Tax=Caenorhabditis japonica TaxID=281687 RepID=A0A8R1E833_CAEJA